MANVNLESRLRPKFCRAQNFTGWGAQNFTGWGAQNVTGWGAQIKSHVSKSKSWWSRHNTTVLSVTDTTTRTLRAKFRKFFLKIDANPTHPGP